MASYASSSNKFVLTTAEQKRLDVHPIIQVAPDFAWPPFEWVNKDLQ